jgi:ubiquinone/menaquinone biosynthesis C-methylase UbiE
MTLFDTIGDTYGDTRQADERIVALLVKHLGLNQGAMVADIGAGTGNYSFALAEEGFRVLAVEPSAVMLRQARPHPRVEWKQGCAENVPLPDASVDGVVSTLALCHFSDVPKALAEMARISDCGPVVIFTFDRNVGRETWLYEYFPFFWDAFDQYPSPDELARMLTRATGERANVITFRLPPDLRDSFAGAAWRRPERYLEVRYRQNISSFRKADPGAVIEGLTRLAGDLTSGVWRMRYGSLLDLADLDVGYRFVCGGKGCAPTTAST